MTFVIEPVTRSPGNTLLDEASPGCTTLYVMLSSRSNKARVLNRVFELHTMSPRATKFVRVCRGVVSRPSFEFQYAFVVRSRTLFGRFSRLMTF